MQNYHRAVTINLEIFFIKNNISYLTFERPHQTPHNGRG